MKCNILATCIKSKKLGSHETGDPEKKKVDQIVFKTGWVNFAGEKSESRYLSPKHHVMNKSTN